MTIAKTVVSRISLFIVLAFTVGVLMMQTPVVNAGHPVTRPIRIQSQVTLLDVFAGAPFAAIDQGVISGLGDYVGVGKWSSEMEGFGILYAANGDQIFWGTVDGGLNVTFTGGTGRFQNVSGGWTITELSGPVLVNGPMGTFSGLYPYKAKGTITY